jgi:uncharacterized protein with von Willebrand factor type A (vWA) domain
MDRRIVEFIAALRNSGVRISLAESSDAFQAIDHMGIQDRETFRISLRSTLVKANSELVEFDRLFPLFFQSGNPPPMMNPSSNLSPDEAQKIADALRQFTKNLRDMLEKLLQGEPLSQEELSQLDKLLKMDDVNDLRYQNWMARQMEKALQFSEVQKALQELMNMLQQMGMNKEKVDQLREMMEANQKAMQEQLRQHSGQKIAENMSKQNRQEKMDGLYNRPFQSLTEEEMQLLRKEVHRLAAVLRTRMALRLKKDRSGQLDVKATLRTNLKNGSVPIEIKHKDHILKPKVVAVCDISTSMRHCSELMLSLLHAIQDQISKTSAFAFIDHLQFISPYFDNNQTNVAVEDILQHMPSGYYNTDLGASLEDFMKNYADKIDSKTTFILVGDARNNYNNPRVDIFETIARRSRNTIWLNPEPVPFWGTGDSDMLQYAPLCKKIFQVDNLNQLSSAIDQLLVLH